MANKRWAAALLAVAVSAVDAAPDDADPMLARQSPLMDAAEQELSARVEGMARRLDRLFGGEDYQRRATGTELRLGLEATWRERDGTELDEIVRLRLRLPHAEERLNLVFESGRDEARRGIDGDQTPLGREQDEYRLGLRYLRDWADRWNLDFDAGLRSGSPVQGFVRGRVGRVLPLGEWQFEPSLALHWYGDDGPGATTRALFQRPLPGQHLFRADSEVTWLRDAGTDGSFFYAQDFLVSRQFGPYHALVYQLGIRGDSEPSDQVTAYFANLRWRRNVYSDWLFVELKPELMFERAWDFEMEPRLQFTVEAWFGGDR